MLRIVSEVCQFYFNFKILMYICQFLENFEVLCTNIRAQSENLNFIINLLVKGINTVSQPIMKPIRKL